MGSVMETIRNTWKIPDLRRKILLTIMMLLIYRIGSLIPIPGISQTVLDSIYKEGTLADFLDIIAGGAFKNMTIFAMSITPYINASIIMQLLTIAIPALERLSKEGEEGRKKIAQITRYATVGLGFLQATGLYFGVIRPAVVSPGILSYLTVTLTLTAGTAFLMWLGEQITEHGIGNGISLLIFAGIISRAPFAAKVLYQQVVYGQGIMGVLYGLLIVAGLVLVMAAIIWIQQAERRIPVQYAKRVVGRKMYGGQSTHIPIKVNLAGVIPIIFAMSILSFPATIVMFVAGDTQNKVLRWFIDSPSSGDILYAIVNALLVMAFTFFYTMMVFNPIELANNMKKNGGFIPGIRPGRPTSDYITKVLYRITWFGALFLASITVLPSIMQQATEIKNVWFGGTSALIMVGVALETVKQIESQLLMRHYKGFLE